MKIDELMTSIANRASSGDSTRVAVLACLHLADKLRTVREKLKSYDDKSGKNRGICWKAALREG